jgi:tetratricopeptide (TPR) repeat protein
LNRITIKTLVLGYSLLMLCATPMTGQAHSPTGQSASFTPAAESEPFLIVLHECVNRTDPRDTHLLSGLGGVQYPLVTLGDATAEAQAFYSQGMILQYGFNFPEAIHAFNKAASLDEGAAMPYWGIALSASSNINSNATNGCNRLAYRATRIALQHARQRQADSAARARYGAEQLQREVDYAEAFATLFQPGGPSTVMVGDDTRQSYARAMENLSATYFDDLDAATLYAVALLNITPWRWWSGNVATSDRVAPTPEAARALQVLNRVLMRNELHAPANHFIIHAIEESPFADSAIPSANRLRDLIPASGHLVHMASHIYQRTGNNALASAVNYSAVSVDRAYARDTTAADVYPLHYLGHNIHFLTWTLSIEGRRDEALNMADELVGNTTQYAADAYLCTHYPEEIALKSDYFYAVPYYYAARFADWGYLDRIEARVQDGVRRINQVCLDATRDSDRRWTPLTVPYTNVMLAYARAYQALTENYLDSAAAIAALSNYWSVARTTLDTNNDLAYGTNKAIDLFRIANLILINRAQQSTGHSLAFGDLQRGIRDQLAAGSASALSDDVQDIRGTKDEQIIAVWKKAVAVQDSLYYNEPPDWYYTLRESLGYAYLAQGQYENAERAFTEDLSNNRLSGRSLFGLRQSLQQQPGKTVPPLLEEQFANAWRNATVSPVPY